MDLVRASLYNAEKRRMESIGKAAARQRNRLADNGSQDSPRQPVTPQTPHETPLQAVFRRRVKGALFDIPIEQLMMERKATPPSNDNNDKPTNTPTRLTFHSGRNPHDLSHLAYASLEELEADEDGADGTPSRTREYEPRLLAFGDENHNKPIMGKQPIPDPFEQNQFRVLQRAAMKSAVARALSVDGEDLDASGTGRLSVAGKIGRRIPTAPTRVLDAPDFVDDYYLNLISWSRDNILAVALGQCVYLWNAASGDIQHLLTLPGVEDYVTSVNWATVPGQSKFLAVGTNSNMVQLYDTQALRRVRTLSGHSGRVGALAWNHQWLTSGGRDSLILQHDVRSANHIVATYKGHEQEVCGLKWNEDGSTLASGGNENYLCIWDAAVSRRNSATQQRQSDDDISTSTPRLLLTQHKAAVKALAWCPFKRELLASGGGSADKTIKFWNTNNGTMLNSVDTGSQVCSLLWSKHQKEIVSSHGFSENQLILWKYPTMTKVQEFKAHTARVLSMEMSPQHGQIVSAAADETLRFWDIFGPPPNRRTAKSGIGLLGDFNVGVTTIR